MPKPQNTAENYTDRLIVHRSPRSPVSEAYRTLRTNIQFGALDRPLRTIMVTSAGPGEGKSTTLVNLAVTLAQAGHRVILIDADLRRPVVHRIFAVGQQRGLTPLLLGKLTPDEALQRTAVDNLWVIPTGPLPPNPSELLDSKAFDACLDDLKPRADYLLLDAPPAIAVADAAILAPKTDGVILVLDAGGITRQMAQRAKEQLERVNARILGAVLNNAQAADEYKYYSYYYVNRN